MMCFGYGESRQRTSHCVIALLDDTQLMHEVNASTAGQDLLDVVFKHLNLLETSYFGLRYVTSSGQQRWLDPCKNVIRQLKDVHPMSVQLGIKFYAADPCKLVEEITRYQFFLQVKQDIAQARLPVAFELAIELFALSVQSELGDYDPQRHTDNYVAEFQFLPNQSLELERRAASFHQNRLAGQVPPMAELNFLERVKWLDMYGCHLFTILYSDSSDKSKQKRNKRTRKQQQQRREINYGNQSNEHGHDENDDQYALGLNPTAVLVLRNKQKIAAYPWARITRTRRQGRCFLLDVLEPNNEINTYGFRLSGKQEARELKLTMNEHIEFVRHSLHLSVTSLARRNRGSHHLLATAPNATYVSATLGPINPMTHAQHAMGFSRRFRHSLRSVATSVTSVSSRRTVAGAIGNLANRKRTNGTTSALGINRNGAGERTPPPVLRRPSMRRRVPPNIANANTALVPPIKRHEHLREAGYLLAPVVGVNQHQQKLLMQSEINGSKSMYEHQQNNNQLPRRTHSTSFRTIDANEAATIANSNNAWMSSRQMAQRSATLGSRAHAHRNQRERPLNGQDVDYVHHNNDNNTINQWNATRSLSIHDNLCTIGTQQQQIVNDRQLITASRRREPPPTIKPKPKLNTTNQIRAPQTKAEVRSTQSRTRWASSSVNTPHLPLSSSIEHAMNDDDADDEPTIALIDNDKLDVRYHRSPLTNHANELSTVNTLRHAPASDYSSYSRSSSSCCSPSPSDVSSATSSLMLDACDQQDADCADCCPTTNSFIPRHGIRAKNHGDNNNNNGKQKHRRRRNYHSDQRTRRSHGDHHSIITPNAKTMTASTQSEHFGVVSATGNATTTNGDAYDAWRSIQHKHQEFQRSQLQTTTTATGNTTIATNGVNTSDHRSPLVKSLSNKLATPIVLAMHAHDQINTNNRRNLSTGSGSATASSSSGYGGGSTNAKGSTLGGATNANRHDSDTSHDTALWTPASSRTLASAANSSYSSTSTTGGADINWRHQLTSELRRHIDARAIDPKQEASDTTPTSFNVKYVSFDV